MGQFQSLYKISIYKYLFTLVHLWTYLYIYLQSAECSAKKPSEIAKWLPDSFKAVNGCSHPTMPAACLANLIQNSLLTEACHKKIKVI